MTTAIRSGDVRSRGLRLHYAEYGDPAAPVLILLHGGCEHGRMWERLAGDFAAHWRVVCPDLRGHGDSEWPSGAGYSTMECVHDLHRLVERLGATRVVLVGHGFGGDIATRYAALMPERVERLVVIEGLGLGRGSPPGMTTDAAPVALRRWLLRQGTAPRGYASQDAAARRLIEADPPLPPEVAAHAARHGLRRLEDGSLAWKYDPAFRMRSRDDIPADDIRRLWTAVGCPVLLVHGAESWASSPDEDGRSAFFHDARFVRIAGAGHNAHHHRPVEVGAAIAAFLAGN